MFPSFLSHFQHSLQQEPVWRVFCQWQNWLSFSAVWAVVATDPFAIFELRVAFWGPSQPSGPHSSSLLQHRPGDPAHQGSTSTSVSSFSSPQLFRGASRGFSLSAYPLPAVDVPAVGLSSFHQLVTTPLPKVSISFQAAS